MNLWPRRPRPVTVPDDIARELLAVLTLALEREHQRSGAVPSRRLMALLYDLHEADLRHRGRASAAIGTLPPAPAIVKTQEVLSVAEAAELMGSGQTWVRRLIRLGRIRARRAGRRAWIIDRASLDTYRYHRETP